MKKDDLLPKFMKFLIVWFLKLLWWLIRWGSLKIYYECLPHKMLRAPSREAVEAFYKSKKWYRLSLQTKNKYRTVRGLECMKCFKSTESKPGLQINTDHIKPLWYYWHLRLDPNNLQILCAGCNKAKGSVDMTDYRGYRPGKTSFPVCVPVPRSQALVPVQPKAIPRREFLIEPTHHILERGWSD